MMKSMIKILSIAALIVAASGTAESARAGGFLADLAEEAGLITEEEADALDTIHEGLGSPLDRAGAAAVQYYAQ